MSNISTLASPAGTNRRIAQLLDHLRRYPPKNVWQGYRALMETKWPERRHRAGKLLPKANIKQLRELAELALAERGKDLGASAIVSAINSSLEQATVIKELLRMFQASVDERGRVKDEHIYGQVAEFMGNFRWCMGVVPVLRNSRVLKFFELTEGPIKFGPHLNDLVDLTAAGLVHRFRRCKYCDKWLFARFTNQQFCSGGKCQKKYRESRTQYKQVHNTIAKRSYHVRQKNKAKQKMGHGTREQRQAAEEKFQKHKEWLERNERK